MESSQYINEQRRDYSLYTLQQRAIPFISDGLKAGSRRVLWISRNGAKHKSATLAGATMPIHPHAAPENSVNTLAGPYGNNIPLLDGDGAFGTLLNPTAYGASRYTSVKVSQFTKDVVFKDIEIIPMQENYDGTIEEPIHFLPLIPISLLNPQEGIAVGFASNLLPRELTAIVKSMILYLEGKDFYEEIPAFTPTNQWAVDWLENPDGTITKYLFRGMFKRKNATTINVFNLPFGMTHDKYTKLLNKLEDNGDIQEYEDNSKDCYDITIRFKKGALRGKDDDYINKILGLEVIITENMTLIDFDGKKVIKTSYGDVIMRFCDWRLEYYEKRYQRLADLLEVDIQRFRDVLRAIAKNVGSVAKRVASRGELKDFLSELEIVHVDYIADLPVYRFTQEEKAKTEKKLKDATALMREYKGLLKSKKKRSIIYINELKEILANWKKGQYNNGVN